MAIFVTESSQVIIQGITGSVGQSFARRMAQHYPNFVGGVTPGRGGHVVAGRPVFDSVAEAVKVTGANTSVITVPAPFAPDAIIEAVEAGIRLISVYTDLIPVHQAARCIHYARSRGCTLIGPNAAGVVSPGLASASELGSDILRPGSIGIVSKSGSLTYEVVTALNEAGLGQSTVCCLGGDTLIGTSYADVIARFDADPATTGMIMLGEVGGDDEMRALPAIRALSKPLIAYIAGWSAPPGKAMGHAGAIVGSFSDSAAAKSQHLKEAGAQVVRLLEELPAVINSVLLPATQRS